MSDRRIAHQSFDIRSQIQIWAEETLDGYDIYQVMDLPGAAPVKVGECKSPMDARIIIDSIISLFARNIIEGTHVDVNSLRGGRIMSLPMSLRTEAGERAYQEAKLNGGTRPLELEPSIKRWQYWRLIENSFPYSVAFKTHHMLVPYRANVSERWDLNDEEKREFERILREFVYPTYDLWFENCPKRRSVARFYHVHLASYVDSREQMSL